MAPKSFRSIADFTRDLLAEAQVARRAFVEYATLAAGHLERDARELMSGKLSLAQLRKMGHPYARRHLRRSPGKPKRRGRAPVLPINVQSGRLRGSLRTDVEQRARSIVVTLSVSAPPYDKYVMDGTSKMLARPLKRELERRGNAVRRIARLIRGLPQ